MGLTNKERCRRHISKLKSDPKKHEEYLARERERYLKRKEQKKIKSIDDLSKTGRRLQRRKWKINQRNSRKRRNETARFLAINSPPLSPAEDDDQNNVQRRGRQRVRRDRAKAYRSINQLQKKLKETENKSERYKKRCQRLQIKVSNPTNIKALPKDVKRRLQFHDLVLKQLKSAGKNNKTLKKFLDYQVLRKYKLLRYASKSTGVAFRTINGSKKGKRSDRPAVIYIQKAKQQVYTFLNRDDNTRIKAGKKETVTRKKVKKQKRILIDSMKNLHMKFLTEYQVKISYSLFCKLRPFWILPPSKSDRETCLCKTHENLQYKAEKLKSLQVLDTSDLVTLAQRITCSIDYKDCMYRECNRCSASDLVYCDDVSLGQQTSWTQWVSRREERTLPNGNSCNVQVTKKVEERGTVEHLLEEFGHDLTKGLRHLYNITHQFRALKELRNNLSDNEAVIHIDFSENYNCKYSSEIQSVHFGASHQQVTLHTGILYTSKTNTSFCSISECNRHDPAAIWAHIAPVIKLVKSNNPNLQTVHFVSDGPTTQYKNKKNFYLFSTRLSQFGMQNGTWNFLEAGHGKGAADGVGAAIKRTADSIVNSGIDIPDAKSLYQELCKSKTGVTLFYVKAQDINTEETRVPEDLQTVKGTMMLHQVLTVKQGEIVCRNVSCFCKKPSICDCYGAFTVRMQIQDAVAESDTSGSLKTIKDVTEDLKGQWCVVEYDKKPFPGIIQDVQSGELEVKVMHRIGNNRFFWPTLIEDIVWYEQQHFITLIDAPTLVTKRHHQIEKCMWGAIQDFLDRKYPV